MKIRITPSYVYLALSLSQVIAAGHVGSQQREDDYVPRGLDDIEQEEVLAQRIRDEEGLKLREGGQDGKTPGKGLDDRIEGGTISLNSNVNRGIHPLIAAFDEVDEAEAKAKALAKAVKAVSGPGSSSGSSGKAKGVTRWPSWDRVKAYVAQTKKAAAHVKEPEQPKPQKIFGDDSIVGTPPKPKDKPWPLPKPSSRPRPEPKKPRESKRPGRPQKPKRHKPENASEGGSSTSSMPRGLPMEQRGFADLVASLHEVENAGSKVAEVGDKARNMADAVGLLHKAEADSKLHKAAKNDGKKLTAKRVQPFATLVPSGLPKRPAIVGSNSAGSVDMIQKIYGGAKPQEKPWPTPKMVPQRLITSAGWRAWPGRLHAQPGYAAPSGFLGHSLRPRPRPSGPRRPEGPQRPGVKRPGRTQRPQRPQRRPKRPKTEGDSGWSSSIPPRERSLGNEPRGMGDLVAGLHEIEAASESIKDVAEKLEPTAASPDKVEHVPNDVIKKVKPVTSTAPSGSQRPSRSQRGHRISAGSQRPLDEIRKIFGGERVKNPPKPPEKPGPPPKVSSTPGNSSRFGKYLGVKHARPTGPRRPGYLQRPQRAQNSRRPLSIQRPKSEAHSGVKSPLSPKPRSLDNEKRGMGDLISSLHDFENAKKKINLEDAVEGNADVISALHEAESSKKLEEVVKKKLKRPIHPSFEKTYQISTGDSAFTTPVPPSKLGGSCGPSGRKSMIHKAIDIYAKGKANDPTSVGIPCSRGWIKTPETGNLWVRPQLGSPERTRPTAGRPFSKGRKTDYKRKSPSRRSLVDHEERGMAEVIAAIHEAESSKTGDTGKNLESSGDKATSVGRRIKEAASARFERLKGAVRSEPSQSARTQSLIRTKWPGGWHELHVQQRPPSPPRLLKRPKSEDGEQAREPDRKIKRSPPPQSFDAS